MPGRERIGGPVPGGQRTLTPIPKPFVSIIVQQYSIPNALLLGAEYGLQESGARLSPDTGRLEHHRCVAQLPRRELAAQGVSGIRLVAGAAIVEPNLAQPCMVGGGAR